MAEPVQKGGEIRAISFPHGHKFQAHDTSGIYMPHYSAGPDLSEPQVEQQLGTALHPMFATSRAERSCCIRSGFRVSDWATIYASATTCFPGRMESVITLRCSW